MTPIKDEDRTARAVRQFMRGIAGLVVILLWSAGIYLLASSLQSFYHGDLILAGARLTGAAVAFFVATAWGKELTSK